MFASGGVVNGGEDKVNSDGVFECQKVWINNGLKGNKLGVAELSYYVFDRFKGGNGGSCAFSSDPVRSK